MALPLLISCKCQFSAPVRIPLTAQHFLHGRNANNSFPRNKIISIRFSSNSGRYAHFLVICNCENFSQEQRRVYNRQGQDNIQGTPQCRLLALVQSLVHQLGSNATPGWNCDNLKSLVNLSIPTVFNVYMHYDPISKAYTGNPFKCFTIYCNKNIC